eukprot:51247-Eustigmatos_ZCMA.PRE.1
MQTAFKTSEFKTLADLQRPLAGEELDEASCFCVAYAHATADWQLLEAYSSLKEARSQRARALTTLSLAYLPDRPL